MESGFDISDSYINNESETDNDGSDSDGDDCDEIELQNTFPKSYSIVCEKTLSLSNIYILHMDYSDQKICVGLSNNTAEVHEIRDDQLNVLCTLNEHTSTIVGVKFSQDEHLLFTGSMDGSVKLWDLRTPQKSVQLFNDTTNAPDNPKPFSCFDYSSNNRVLCVGTELYEGDSFMIFWDIRNTKFLGGYWESHMDDITKVLFHPTDRDKLASCSTDGLINIYDLTQTSEDDALITSLNTESSVEQILWYTQNNQDAIASVMHPTEVQLWRAEEGVFYAKYSREVLSKEIKRKSPEHCYVANMHTDSTGENLYLLTGSNWNDGECVRGINVQRNELSPSFILDHNKQRIRTSYYDSKVDLLITGGEKGILNVWKSGIEKNIPPLKDRNYKLKHHKKKPY